MQKNRLNIFVTTFHYALAAAQLNFVLTMIIILQYHIKKQNNLRLLLLVEMSGGGGGEMIILGKKWRTSEWWNKFFNNEVPESDWKEKLCLSSNSFKEICNIEDLFTKRTHNNESTNFCGNSANFCIALVTKDDIEKYLIHLGYLEHQCH